MKARFPVFSNVATFSREVLFDVVMFRWAACCSRAVFFLLKFVAVVKDNEVVS